ncbi:MAG: DEAD/DEAH box helicase, partial [Deltaproteobacteria bacterium]|nr:DEAD/DEAH box helicase [Deltaproteobacteria bacterium]
ISKLAKEALTLSLEQQVRVVFQNLLTRFDSFDSLAINRKKERIEESLTILSQIQNDIAVASISSSAEVSFSEGKKLSTPIQFIKGVGPKLSELLGKKGIQVVGDALYFLPRKYEDRRRMKKISEIIPHNIETVKGTLQMLGGVPYRGGKKRIFEIAVGDGSGILIAKWFQFNERYMRTRFKKGQQVILSGEIEQYRLQKEVHHPEIEIIEPGEEESWEFMQIIPIYSETEGLYPKTMRRIMRRVVDEYSPVVIDGIPESIRKKQRLVGLSEAVKNAHFPDGNDDFDILNEGKSPAHRRLIFDEFFFLELGLALRKKGVILEKGITYVISDRYINKLRSILPFKLTTAQEKVVQEIMGDLKKPYPMNRLLQGDVGSGKTVVALIASLVVIENGYQAAFMAPTEILADQHYSTISTLAEKLGIKIILLTSSMKG